MRNVRNRGFKHCGKPDQSSVLACRFREVRDAIVVRIVTGRRVTVYRSDLVELLGLITCLVEWDRPGSQTRGGVTRASGMVSK